jgi:hypothetical protein
MTMVALFMRSYAERNAPAVLGTDPQLLRTLLDFPQGGWRPGRAGCDPWRAAASCPFSPLPR